MKKSNRLLIKIGLMFIFLCFLCIILCSNNVLALELALKKGEKVTTGAELWDKTTKPKGKTVYCIQPGVDFESGDFEVTKVWKIYHNENGECIVECNGSEYNGNLKEEVIEKAYIFAENDPEEKERLKEGFKICSDWDEESQRSIKQGIYDVLSYKQEALWMSQLGDTPKAMKEKWFWQEKGAKLVYHWDLVGNGKRYELRYQTYK